MTPANAYGSIAEGLAQTATQKGSTVAVLSDERPLLLIFLRHFG